VTVSRPQDPSAERPVVRALVGVSGWKHATLEAFFGGEAPFFANAAEAVAHARAAGGGIGVWATREPADLAGLAAAAHVPVARIEDGFVRSVGLGSDLIPGASVVADWRGIYYDPGQPSDLEVILETAAFDDALRARAAALRTAIVRAGLTKYNLAAPVAVARTDRARRWILAPGQVEDDRSVALGGAGITTNLALLARVRAENPDSHIIFKPHPDVEAGHRQGRVTEAAALRHADQVVANGSITALFDVVDEIHTLTSLAGFEAMLRGLPVTTYGQPFYAGWGLTTDKAPASPRRSRRLHIDELVAGALVLYPSYIDPETMLRCEPEVLIERLAARRFWSGGPMVSARRLQGAVIKALYRVGVDLRKGR
jgi:capsular polysaccharide export protein